MVVGMKKTTGKVRAVVDAGVGGNGELMRQAKSWLGSRAAEYCLLDEEHKGIPDVEILDKVLGAHTVLITKDRVLHNRALREGFQSLTLDKNGRLPRVGTTVHGGPALYRTSFWYRAAERAVQSRA